MVPAYQFGPLLSEVPVAGFNGEATVVLETQHSAFVRQGKAKDDAGPFLVFGVQVELRSGMVKQFGHVEIFAPKITQEQTKTSKKQALWDKIGTGLGQDLRVFIPTYPHIMTLTFLKML